VFNRKVAKLEKELEEAHRMIRMAQDGWREALASVERLQKELRAMIYSPCKPQTWPSNACYQCQHGHLHHEQKAIGGDFPL
jgi:hypothetical protein